MGRGTSGRTSTNKSTNKKSTGVSNASAPSDSSLLQAILGQLKRLHEHNRDFSGYVTEHFQSIRQDINELKNGNWSGSTTSSSISSEDAEGVKRVNNL